MGPFLSPGRVHVTFDKSSISKHSNYKYCCYERFLSVCISVLYFACFLSSLFRFFSTEGYLALKDGVDGSDVHKIIINIYF